MSVKRGSKASSREIPSRMISEEGTSRSDAVDNPQGSRKTLQRRRRNVNDLEDAEFKRYYMAIYKMKADASPTQDPLNDWWNLCSIHGGHFGKTTEIQHAFKPMYARYLQVYSALRLTNRNQGLADDDQPFDPTDPKQWADYAGYCAHKVPTFLVWHRVYMHIFEMLLDHYDPEPENPEPIAAHYWMWDMDGITEPPNRCSDIPLTDYEDKAIENPLFRGPTGEFRKGRDIHNGLTFRASEFDPLNKSDLAQGYNAFKKESDYSKMATANGNANSFEDPHNMLHNLVGGINDNGDMSNVEFSCFDPIFWLHHSNIERMHFAWLAKNPVPTSLVDNHGNELINLELFPFPVKEKLAYTVDYYKNLPWKTDNRTGPHGEGPPVSRVREWLDNETLPYSYDNVSHVCEAGKDYAPVTFFSSSEKTHHHVTSARKRIRKLIHLPSAPVRGTGLLSIMAKVGDTEIPLRPRPIFSVKGEIRCAACEANPLNLVWEVFLSPRLAKESEGKPISVISAVFHSKHEKDGEVLFKRDLAIPELHWFNDDADSSQLEPKRKKRRVVT
jgi:hypothetical protein